jgi:SpoVK/Ycf46/Vps4 family AAA+-type ATPase
VAIARIHLAPAEPYLAEGLHAVAAWIADATEGLSGADLKGLCDEARYAALVRAGTRTGDASRPVVALDDFRRALADQHGRVTEEDAASAPTPLTHRAVR